MDKKTDKNNSPQKSILKDLAATFIFNTIIALLLYFSTLKNHSFIDVWIISQFMGLSICFFIVMILLFTRINTKAELFGKIMAGLTAGAVTGAAAGYLFLYLKYDVPFYQYFQNSFSRNFMLGIFFAIPITYFLISLEKIKDYENLLKTEKIKRLTLEKQAISEKLKALQAQIEPHFLFNTLSNLRSLLDEDIKKGKTMLDELNGFLKISLKRTREETISLSQELALVNHYLNIHKIRMGPRLSFEIIADKEIKKITFSPLLIQPLVENAVKYGLEPKIEGGRIVIKCSIKDNFLIIEVSDTGCGLDLDKKTGTGINNVSKRINSMYGNNAGLTIMANDPCGTKALIEVPL